MNWFFVLSGVFAGAVLGYFLRQYFAAHVLESAEQRARKVIEEAKQQAQHVLLDAKRKAVAALEEIKREERERKHEASAIEQRLEKREATLDAKLAKLERQDDELAEKVEQARAVRKELETLKEKELAKLEELAGLPKEQAREFLLGRVAQEHSEDLARRIQKLEQEGLQHIEERVKETIFTVLQRYAGSHASEVTTTTVALPSDDIKGRIIGREGRNIKTLERETGVEILVDDTPGAITISGFDPIRRHIAKLAIEKLIADGRIQPARIEEEVLRAKNDVDKIIREAGETAVYEVGLVGFDPKLVHLIGRLRFRTSYGQNVLLHSIEAAHIAGMLAAELGADVAVSKKAALVHDIGKAIDHEIEGTHVEIGRRILAKFGVEEAVIKAMQSHHEDYPYETLEAVIVKVAESISAARPGARRDTLENYLKRLEELENIANTFPGVERSYAIQAGREIRVFVKPESVDDFQAYELAKAIAKKIEETLQYPGEIKVHVIRETRVVEYAK